MKRKMQVCLYPDITVYGNCTLVTQSHFDLKSRAGNSILIQIVHR